MNILAIDIICLWILITSHLDAMAARGQALEHALATHHVARVRVTTLALTHVMARVNDLIADTIAYVAFVVAVVLVTDQLARVAARKPKAARLSAAALGSRSKVVSSPSDRVVLGMQAAREHQAVRASLGHRVHELTPLCAVVGQ